MPKDNRCHHCGAVIDRESGLPTVLLDGRLYKFCFKKKACNEAYKTIHDQAAKQKEIARRASRPKE